MTGNRGGLPKDRLKERDLSFRKTLILGLVLTALGAGIPILGLFGPPAEEAGAAVLITNTCTGVYWIGGNAPVLSGSDTAAGVLLAGKPVAGISTVQARLTAGDTGILLMFSSDMAVETYCIIRTNPDGSTVSFLVYGDTYLDSQVAGDTIYSYSVFALRTDYEAGDLSDPVPTGISTEGGIFSASTPDSVTIEVVAQGDSRVLLRIPRPDSAFGASTGMVVLNIKLLSLDELPIPAWAKKGLANFCEVYCKVFGTSTYITEFSAPLELRLAYDIYRGKVKGTSVKVDDIPRRLSNFKWLGDKWMRIHSVIDMAAQTVTSQTYNLSYWAVADLSMQQEPGFPNYGAFPNPFTPNGDGYSDAAYFKFPAAQEAGVFEIYDLNGAKVYRKEILQGMSWISWDGNYNFEGAGRSDPADAGIYIWQAKVGYDTWKGIIILAK